MKKTIIAGSLGLFPLLAFAQGGTGSINFGYFQSLVGNTRNLLDGVIPILIGIGLIVFFWGLVQYIYKPEAETGRRIMVAGLVGLFVMVSVWGIIRLAQGVLNIQSNRDAEQNLQAPNTPR